MNITSDEGWVIVETDVKRIYMEAHEALRAADLVENVYYTPNNQIILNVSSWPDHDSFTVPRHVRHSVARMLRHYADVLILKEIE